jgi:hypothetical protein
LWVGVGWRRCCIAQLYSCAGRAALRLAMDRGNRLGAGAGGEERVGPAAGLGSDSVPLRWSWGVGAQARRGVGDVLIRRG